MGFLRAFVLVLLLGLALVFGLRLLGDSAQLSIPAPAPAAPRPAKALAGQAAIVAQAASALKPQRAGQVDLFTVGFAGDGTERVFRNEVEYFATLMSKRFDAEGHTLSLVNSPEVSQQVPMATLDNLRDALRRASWRMDLEEDVLVLFLTSHGSSEHVFVVDRPPLMLQQIKPRDLRAALDDAGIRWRVVIVSACYSGGFINDLRDPRTLVITAARQDRSSFGCGAESKITFFGDAFLTRALNETTDFQAAFSQASDLIRKWEKEDGDKPSEPQMSVGAEIGAKLAAWQAKAKPGPRVPFSGK